MSEKPIESFMRNGLRVSIFHDPDASSPRENDNLSTMACKHRRYNLGDKGAADPSEEDALAVLPLYLYDHSGLTIRTDAFSDRFDSGQVGWAYVTKESAEKMGCVGEKYRRDPESGHMVPDGTRIMRTQAQVPKGWKLDWERQPGGIRALVWFCPKCQSERGMS